MCVTTNNQQQEEDYAKKGAEETKALKDDTSVKDNGRDLVLCDHTFPPSVPEELSRLTLIVTWLLI